MSDTSDTSDTSGHAPALRELCRAHGRHSRWSTLAVAAGALQTVSTITLAALLAYVLHGLIMAGQTFAALHLFWLLMLHCLAVRALAGWAREEAGMRLSLEVRRSVRQSLLDALHRLGTAWMVRQRTGSLSAMLMEQVEALDGYFARYRPQQWLAVLTPLMILAVVFPFSWLAALILALTAPLIPLFMILVGWGARQRQTEQLQVLQRMGGHFLDLIRGLPTLQLFNVHHRMGDEVAQVADEFRQRTMRVLRLAFLSGAALEFFASVAIALSAVYFGLSLLGKLDLGFYGQTLDLRLALFVLLLAPEFYLPLRDLGTHYHARAEALAAAGELMAVLKASSPQPAGGEILLPPRPPSLQLEGVGFAHREGELVLEHCSLQVHSGETIAIQGPSGGGKTTVLRLLLGQLQAGTGRVLIGGHPIESLDLAHWRERVAWMSQHPRLMADNLAANLRVARVDASDAELEEALAFAGLKSWFAALPDGLATRLGEGGRPLSGGQLRRLALARVSLRRADVLLLDEPTASLDPDTEASIIERIGELAQGKTTVLLTHRPGPLRMARRVFHLSHGKLATTANGKPECEMETET
jgi:ATP-binding cassette subfamily C protein CydD